MSAEQLPDQLSKEMFVAIQRDVEEVLDRSRALLALERPNHERGRTLQALEGKFNAVARKFTEKAFRVAVVGLTKSGKSTLLNAWLGARFLPESNRPETARIVRIRHTPDAGGGMLLDRDAVVARGAREVNARLRAMNAEIRERGHSPPEDELVLRAPLVALGDRRLEAFGFEVLDAPGPNDAGAEHLRAKVISLLDGVDVIVYLLDYTKLNSSDEARLFEELAELRPELLTRCSGRMFFAVNKIDQQHSGCLTPEETAEYAVKALRKSVPQLELTPDRVLTVSARCGLLARLVLNGPVDADVLHDFKEVVFGMRGAQGKSVEDCRKEAPAVLMESQLVALERRILDHVYTQRRHLLLRSTLEDLRRHLEEFKRYFAVVSGTLNGDITMREQQLAQLHKVWETAQGGMKQVWENASDFQAGMVRWTEERFAEFQAQVHHRLTLALRGEEFKAESRGYTLLDKFLDRLWQSMDKEAVENIFRQFPILKKESVEDSVRDSLLKLQRDIAAGLRQAFAGFRADFEQEAHDRQAELFALLEKQITPMVQLVASKVGQTLKVQLQPIDVQLQPPSLDELHQDIENRVGEFIRCEEEQSLKRKLVKKGGLCSSDEYEDVALSRIRFSASEKDVTRFWKKRLDELTKFTVATAKRLIEEKVLQAIQMAQAEIDEKAGGLVQIVEHEIGKLKRGEDAQQQRLVEVHERLESVNRNLFAVRRCLEALGAEGGRA